MEIPADRLALYASPEWLHGTLQTWELASLFGSAPSPHALMTEERPYVTVAVKASAKRELCTPDVALTKAVDTALDLTRATKQLRMSSGGAANAVTSSSGILATDHVQAWFDGFHGEGRRGNIGLVPEPLRHAYPKNAPHELDPATRAYVEHFCAWFVRK